MPDFLRMYSKQEYQTPGAARTVGLLADTVQPTEKSWLLDVASGKGEAAATLASHHGCSVVAIEPYDPHVHYSAAKFWHWNLRDLITLLRADGRRVPVRDGAFDAAYCIGAPSIVGLEACLRELARAVRAGGHVVVSDIVWRTTPEDSLGPEWLWVASFPQISLDEYTAVIESMGLKVEQTQIHPRSDWEDYWRPMLEVAAEAKVAQPSDVEFADEIESAIAVERRAVETWLDYCTFVAGKVVA
jgi:cyclopropane fatty-acyl-phospholipid synthase-like methyltransferase